MFKMKNGSVRSINESGIVNLPVGTANYTIASLEVIKVKSQPDKEQIRIKFISEDNRSYTYFLAVESDNEKVNEKAREALQAIMDATNYSQNFEGSKSPRFFGGKKVELVVKAVPSKTNDTVYHNIDKIYPVKETQACEDIEDEDQEEEPTPKKKASKKSSPKKVVEEEYEENEDEEEEW